MITHKKRHMINKSHDQQITWSWINSHDPSIVKSSSMQKPFLLKFVKPLSTRVTWSSYKNHMNHWSHMASYPGHMIGRKVTWSVYILFKRRWLWLLCLLLSPSRCGPGPQWVPPKTPCLWHSQEIINIEKLSYFNNMFNWLLVHSYAADKKLFVMV